MAGQQIRIRDNGTVRPFKIPSDKLEGILKIQKSNVSDLVKENVIRKLLERRSLCCICRGIPTQEVIYPTIDMLEEINDSYDSEYDKHEPRLLLCAYCQKEYMIPGYPFE